MYEVKTSVHKASIQGISDYQEESAQFDSYLDARRYLDKKVKEFQKKHPKNNTILKATSDAIRIRVSFGDPPFDDMEFIFLDGEVKEV